jgi:hypothetical protein
MARSDLLMSLVRAGSRGDRLMFRRTLEALVADERAKNHHVLADRLAEYVASGGPPEPIQAFGNGGQASGGDFLYQKTPALRLRDLVLSDGVASALARVVQEQARRDLLRSHGLEPTHRILLAGPPGNGKTSLAEALAYELAVPLFVVRYEAIIGSYLGETSQRLRKAIEFARGHQCVLFFDEFDAIAKERGDTHETGEIKRVVSSLLMQIDDLPSHVVVVTASNHPELLDRAVWRRFQVRLELPAPTARQVADWLVALEGQIGEPFGIEPAALGGVFRGASFSDLQEFSENLMRAVVLAAPDANVPSLVRECLVSRKAQYSLGRHTRVSEA